MLLKSWLKSVRLNLWSGSGHKVCGGWWGMRKPISVFSFVIKRSMRTSRGVKKGQVSYEMVWGVNLSQMRGWVSLLEVGWFTKSLWEVRWAQEPGWACKRLGEPKRAWVCLWEVGWACEKLADSVRGCVSLWEVGYVCERLDESVRDWMSLREVGLVCKRLDESVRSWVILWEVGWVCDRLG